LISREAGRASSIIKEVAATPGICKTLVIDTADWAEQLICSYLCAKYKQNSIESFGYGKGYTYLAEEFARLLSACDLVIAAGINVVITAHAKMRKFEQPDEMGAYDRWEMKLSKQVAPLLKEWCDMLLFCNYQTFVVTSENDTKKAQGGKRVIYTAHHPAWDAKSRIKLPEVIDLDYKNLAFIFDKKDKPKSEAPAASAKETGNTSGNTGKTAADTAKTPTAASGKTSAETGRSPIDTLRKMMADAGVTDEDVQKVVASKGHYDISAPIESYHEHFITGWVIKYWPQILNLINANKTVLD